MRGAAVGQHRVRAAVRIADAVHLFLYHAHLDRLLLRLFLGTPSDVDTLRRGVRPSDQADVDHAHRSTGDRGGAVDYYFESPRAAAERGKKHRASQTAFCHKMHNKFNLSPW